MALRTDAESSSSWLEIFAAMLPLRRRFPERVRLTGVCQPLLSIRATYTLEEDSSTV